MANRKKIMDTRKGVAFSTIAILALVGILLVSIWAYGQLATGSRFGASITQRQPQDIAISRLELAKQFLTQNLKFSSSSASVEIAANGGTQVPKTYWYCNDKAIPPELEEVKYSLSNSSHNFLSAYISTLSESELENLGVTVSPYECVGIDDPGQSNCLLKDTSHCESFTSTGTQGGLIEVSDPAYVSYGGDLASDVSTDRFFMFYYKLYKDTKESGLTRSIAQGLRESCTQRGAPSVQRLQFALQKACDHFEALFEEPDGKRYVECEYEILCIDTVNPTACTNVNCERPAFSKQLCWEKASSSPQVSVDLSGLQNFFDGIGGKTVSAQGASFGGIEIIFHLTDTKYKVSSAQGPVNLVWNLNAVLNVANQECRPIDTDNTS